MSTAPELSYDEIAALVGVSADTIRTYQKRAVANRRAGAPRPTDLPEPRRRVGQSPLWDGDEISEWIKARENRALAAREASA
ncbi:helix-turn-helix DNA binding domain protein [Arthrobacter phage Prairie]|uniref:Helix-turn-helix DNA binding domain protein n=1 Tax=Arthrobacter phage Prairie TaxID=2816463 RepID=A0A8A5LQY3_9CAUD|nr:helix-turn-helix DNA binding domain protein [Arthrobacter phage Prairie]